VSVEIVACNRQCQVRLHNLTIPIRNINLYYHHHHQHHHQHHITTSSSSSSSLLTGAVGQGGPAVLGVTMHSRRVCGI
jgi:hypothetical protein